MSNWYVYLAQSSDEFISGITDDLIKEEILLKTELSNDNSIIGWHKLYENKVDALKKLKEINNLTDDEKQILILTFNKIIVLKDEDYKENYDKYPLIYNLKQTLQLSSYFQENPEIWKLDEIYVENVSEYLSVRRTQLEFTKLWNIAMDYSNNVGLVTKSKFFPIIKYK
jgi:predicted GIY-YIG superfamily endonuclease